MANQYDTNLKLQAIADAIGNSQSSGLISALEDIADAVTGGGGGGSSTAGLVSDNFSETDTYDLGDYCIHNNTLYVCINAITTPGAWDLSDWQATNAGMELSSLNSALEWKSAGTTSSVNLSSITWRELMCVACYTRPSTTVTWSYVLNALNKPSFMNKRLWNGYGYQGNTNSIAYTITNGVASVTSFLVDGTDQVSNATYEWFYR